MRKGDGHGRGDVRVAGLQVQVPGQGYHRRPATGQLERGVSLSGGVSLLQYLLYLLQDLLEL